MYRRSSGHDLRQAKEERPRKIPWRRRRVVRAYDIRAQAINSSKDNGDIIPRQGISRGAIIIY